MKVLVTGSRYLTQERHGSAIREVLGALGLGHATLVHGDAPGADTIAGRMAMQWGWSVSPYPADWDREGRAAGPLRNQRMLDAEHRVDLYDPIDLVLAFPDQRSRGTWDMIERAVLAHIPVRVYVLEADVPA